MLAAVRDRAPICPHHLSGTLDKAPEGLHPGSKVREGVLNGNLVRRCNLSGALLPKRWSCLRPALCCACRLAAVKSRG